MPTWCITIPEIGLYEQREGDTGQAWAKAMVVALEARCTPNIGHGWTASDPYAYQRPVKLAPLLVPDKARHGWLEALRCRLGRRCRHCDDQIRVLRIHDDNDKAMGVPTKIPGRRTLEARNLAGEYGTLRVALHWDLMLGIPPDPEAVEAWLGWREDVATDGVKVVPGVTRG